MPPNRIAPSHEPNRTLAASCMDTHAEGSRALVTLSKWILRHAEKTTGTNTPDATALIGRTHARQLASRGEVFERHLPFSMRRFVLGLISLALVFSDIPRSGVGVSNLLAIYPTVQPDEMMGFGTSWNYSAFSATKAEASSGSIPVRVWSYKFDSTSIVWRVFASFLSVPNFPACFSYSKVCPDDFFGSEETFAMVDSLVNAIRNTRNLKPTGLGPIGLTLRSENEYVDRLHQFLLPPWFPNINWRTNSALYYSPEVLETMNTGSICFPINGKQTKTPQFCQELWTNFQRSCATTDSAGKSVGLLYEHTMKRLRDVQARFPNSTVDLTFMESQEDVQVSRGGLTSSGFRRSDVSTVIRAQKCIQVEASSLCETEYLSDYRYETGLFMSDVVQWYRPLAALRMTGQSYFLLRGVGLILSCYFIHGTPNSQKKTSFWIRLRKAQHLFVKVPKQCIVYGSPFPIVCYVLAHLLDAPFTYQVLEGRFFTQSGILYLPFRLFISYVVVQMRNVWVFALLWHIAMTVLTSRWLTRSNRLHNGIIGVPGFFLSSMSSVTLLAQYRSTTFRSAKVLGVTQIPNNIGRAWIATKYQYSFARRGKGNESLGGVIIDLKFLVCMVLTLAVAWMARALWLSTFVSKTRRRNLRHPHWFVLAPTPVPYSAGVLWPSTSMCVHWTTSFFCIRDEHPRRLQAQKEKRSHQTRFLRWRTDGRIAPFTFSSNLRKISTQDGQMLASKYTHRSPPVRIKMNTFRYIQHQMKCLHGRSAEVEANVAFINAVVMSDPLVYLRMKFGSDRSTDLAYYQSLLRPKYVVLLPVMVVGEHNEYTNGLKLLRRVNASKLTWPELVQCG